MHFQMPICIMIRAFARVSKSSALPVLDPEPGGMLVVGFDEKSRDVFVHWRQNPPHPQGHTQHLIYTNRQFF